MGIITKEIDIRLSNRIISYYENLGYKIPRRIDNQGRLKVPFNTIIKVKVADLTRSSHALVTVKCDNCGKEYQIPYRQYLMENRNGNVYCHACANTLFISGENHGRWNFDKSLEERQLERKYPEYTEFIKKVMLRDNYICQVCGIKINDRTDAAVHHLDSYDWCIDRRTDTTNGICLCGECHKNFHSKYGYGNNTQTQFEEWIERSVKYIDKPIGEIPQARKVYCFEDNKVYDSAKYVSKMLDVTLGQISRCCNINDKVNKVVKGKHYLWYDDYEKMTKTELNQYLINKHLKPVYCITTNKKFNSMTEASIFYNIGVASISNCCRNKSKYSGKLSDGTKLKWCYYDSIEKSIII